MSGLLPAPDRLFHLGIVVPDIEEAIAAMSRENGQHFSAPWPSEQEIRTPSGIARVGLTMSYSAEGPVRLELIQAVPGTLWAVEGPGVLHHVGYWTDDFRADADRLLAAGLEPAFENVPPEGEDPSFGYFRSGLGHYVELVHTSMRPILEELWAATLQAAQARG